MGDDHRRDRCTGLAPPLPPGFRFRPTDEELLTHYLARKAADAGFAPAAVRDVDLYRAEPWDLLPAAGGEDDYGEDGCRYFFCARRVKFPSGTRTNRATRVGYWKSTGKDKVVVAQHGGGPLGVKKTLVFYRGRAPRGDKTGWVMHEYRLVVQGHASCSQTFARGGAHIEWVICRMFMKKQPQGEASREQETILHPPLCGDHLQMSTDGKTPAAATAAGSESEHPNCFSDAEAMAPGDHETYQQGLLQLIEPRGFAGVNYPETDGLSPSALAQATTLLREEQAADSWFDRLPQLLDYEHFPFVHDL